MRIFWIWGCFKYFSQIPWNSVGVEGWMSDSGQPFSGLSRDVWLGSGHGRHSQSSLRHPCLVLAVFLELLSGWKERIQVSLTANQPPRPSSWKAPPPRSLRGWYCLVFLQKQHLELRQKRLNLGFIIDYRFWGSESPLGLERDGDDSPGCLCCLSNVRVLG